VSVWAPVAGAGVRVLVREGEAEVEIEIEEGAKPLYELWSKLEDGAVEDEGVVAEDADADADMRNGSLSGSVHPDEEDGMPWLGRGSCDSSCVNLEK
jgi:hypothetical protein